MMQGVKRGNNTFKAIMSSIKNLQFFEVGKSIRNEYYVDCPNNWFLLYSYKNYFIFSRNETTVTVLKMYNEKQDFIYDMFGIEMRSQDSKDYWCE